MQKRQDKTQYGIRLVSAETNVAHEIKRIVVAVYNTTDPKEKVCVLRSIVVENDQHSYSKQGVASVYFKLTVE